MASGWTDKGLYQVLGGYFAAQTIPTTFDLRLVTSAVAPDANTTVFSALTEVNTDGGYAADGEPITRGLSPEFNTWTEAAGSAYIELDDIVWTATAAGINSASYAVLCNDTSGGTAEVYAYFDLSGPHSVTDGQTLTLADCRLTLASS